MKTNIVYLHIEKAAGSAQRLYFYHALGQDNVYWHGVPAKDQLPTDPYEYFVVGGHQAYSFYRQQELIYTSVVRNPVERVLSYWNYCKEIVPQIWIPLGFDVHSLANTLRKCERFRASIQNAQCRYISGMDSFGATLGVMENGTFLIGCIEQVDTYNSSIARELGLRYGGLPKDNVGRSGYADEIELDEECLSDIEQLVQEDTKLYRFISEDCKGLYSSVTASRWQSARLVLENLSRADSRTQHDIRPFSEFELLAAILKESGTVCRGQPLRFEVEFLVKQALEKLEIAITIADVHGRLVFEANSAMLGKALVKVRKGMHRAQYSLTADLRGGQYTASFSFYALSGDRYRDLGRYERVATFEVHELRAVPSLGYACLPCEFAYHEDPVHLGRSKAGAAGALHSQSVVGDVEAGRVFRHSVRLENLSAEKWVSSVLHPIDLSYRWIDETSGTTLWGGLYTRLTVAEIQPGQAALAHMEVLAPSAPGQYRLVLAPVQDGQFWGEHCGFISAILNVRVLDRGAFQRYAGGDPRLLSQTGRREQGAMLSTGKEGFLLFGPYVHLPVGRYVARLEGVFNRGAHDLRMDVSIDVGREVLAKVNICRSAASLISELAFELKEPSEDLEVRLWAPADAQVRVDALCIEPCD